MKLIYWNTKNNNSLDCIIDILEDYDPDFLFLSEIDEVLLEKGNTDLNRIDFEYYDNPGCDRVKIVKKKSLKCNLNYQTKYYTTIYLPILDLHIVSVHLPSQMFQHQNALKCFIRDVRNEIDSKIGNSNLKNIIIIGDFNVNPFEPALIEFDGFGATNSTNFRRKISHLSTNSEKILYYNPTWKLYEKNHFPGSKYFARPSGSSFDILEHHLLDQVLISRNLLFNIESEKIDFIVHSKKNIFFDNLKNKILISDHLPLSFEFELK
ncbi:exonuclease/endonuclease/phosphatase family protein [Flavobacterium plurextorum]|nr:hypothetical protein [Flavobacterium plurextorum]